jgi:dolichol kinase
MDHDPSDVSDAGPRGTTDASLEALIERTRGLQPWRKIFHACTGLALAGFLSIPWLTRTQALIVLGSATVVLVAFDALRTRNRTVNALFFRVFSKLASPREASGMASSSWYAAGATVVTAFFSRDVAVSAMLVLGLADASASVVGQRWGKRPLLGGTVEGMATFFIVAGAILLARHAPAPALLSAMATTLAERNASFIDDNFTVPVACAVVLSVTAMLL